MLLDELLRSAFPTRDPSSLTGIPFDQLGHARRALVFSAVCAVRADLSPHALTEETTWSDIASWLEVDDCLLTPKARRSGARVRLRPLRPSDTPSIYTASLDPATSHRWRLRGRTISPDEFERTLHEGVLCQFAVVDHDDVMQGLVVAYSPDLAAGHTYFAFLRTERQRRTPGGMIDGALLFLGYLFERFPIRQVYLEVPAHNLPLVMPLTDNGFLVEVARYPDHVWSPSGFEALHVYVLHRARWLERAPAWLPSVPVEHPTISTTRVAFSQKGFT